MLPAFQIVPERGSFTAFKRTRNGVIRISILKDSKRTSTLIGRKCRASKIKVLSGEYGPSLHDASFVYAKDAVIEVFDYDDDIRVECTRGIHFFLTEAEAKSYE
jgi:hypothetical protein